MSELLLDVLSIGLGFEDAEVSFGADVLDGGDGRWGWAKRKYEDVDGKPMWVASLLPRWFESFRALDRMIWGWNVPDDCVHGTSMESPCSECEAEMGFEDEGRV